MKFSITRRSEPTDGRWHPPAFDMPVTIEERDLEILGADPQGRAWFRHKKRADYGEIREGSTFGANSELPDGLLLQQVDPDGAVSWRSFTCYEPGTLEQLRHAPRREPKPLPDHQPVDRLALAWLADRKPERVIAPTSKASFGADLVAATTESHRRQPHITPPEGAARGPDAILARLRSAGAEVFLAADGEHLVVTARGGRPRAGVIELVEITERLLVAHLKGHPLDCELTAHPTPQPAITVALGGAAACAACLAGSSAAIESEVA